MLNNIDVSIESSEVQVDQLSNGQSKTEKIEREFEVFISYRTNPDHGLAVALKELIEGTIEKKPNVFVASAGGLRPAQIGYKPQIQAAAQSSRAFIAIITQQSKEREWLFYEAGAAWVRNVLFVPLLIDTSPSDLASTMADYQTVRASDRDEVELLLNQVAKAVDGTVKSRFGQRYKAFYKQIEAYQKVEIVEKNLDESPSLSLAIELVQSGEVEEANRLFDQLEDSASTNEEKVRVKINRWLNSEHERRNLLNNLQSLPLELRNTSGCQLWLGLVEPRVAASISHYEECLRLATGNNNYTLIFNRATVNLAEKKFKIGEQEIALDTLRKAMLSEDRDLRTEAVETWQNLDKQSHFFERLVILSTGLSDKPESSIILTALTELAINQNWSSLLTYFAQRADQVDVQGTAANNLGRAYHQLELYSLAYFAYAKAVKAGVSVAKVNIAALHRWQPLPAAGLKLLQEHTGIYDCADAGFPYIVRSELERIVQQEHKKANELYNQGSKLAVMLGHFGWEAIRSHKIIPDRTQIELESGIVTITVNEPNFLKFVYCDETVCLELKRVGRTIGLWQSANAGSPTILYCFTEEGYMLELSINLTESSVEPVLKKYPITSVIKALPPSPLP